MLALNLVHFYDSQVPSSPTFVIVDLVITTRHGIAQQIKCNGCKSCMRKNN